VISLCVFRRFHALFSSVPLNPHNMPDPNGANGRTDGPNVHGSLRTLPPTPHELRFWGDKLECSFAACWLHLAGSVLAFRFESVFYPAYTLDSFVVPGWRFIIVSISICIVSISSFLQVYCHSSPPSPSCQSSLTPLSCYPQSFKQSIDLPPQRCYDEPHILVFIRSMTRLLEI